MRINDTSALRSFLLDQMTAVAEGKLDVGQAKSISNFAQQVYNTVKLEMQFASLKSKGDIQQIEPVKWSVEPKQKNLRAA